MSDGLPLSSLVLEVYRGLETGEPFDEFIVMASPRDAVVHYSAILDVICWECDSDVCVHCRAVLQYEHEIREEDSDEVYPSISDSN